MSSQVLAAVQTWILILIITVVAIFIYYYYMTSGPPIEQKGVNSPISSEQLFSQAIFDTVSSDPVNLNMAKIIYTEKCAVCHGLAGQGGIGPNLTDRFWLRGDGGASGIYNIIVNGVLTKGMPAWAEILPVKDIMALTFFVTKLKGTMPLNPKMPQGREYP
ncbi:MAG: hypothetical protein HN353_10550 [Bdellovibrionales bacterium]|jgi:mono/diheme cytochrome c family protein|nr:hypothetical protein [Bdellovibrionales bacterium]MBT3524733.1 hypothetical protein [Bdellovibrionales bacterium]MBT7669203.1 hypothetical protein [Bdellovibrionales bacterium]MBT7767132.1 hypothetical protein [Bdellovibrionales bacterium]